jgi:cell fate regulator YaaT (PSP1 superfamily)
MSGINIAKVQFKRAGKLYDFSVSNLSLRVGDKVVVDTEKGPSLGEVVTLDFQLPSKKNPKKLKPVLRRASAKDLSPPQQLAPEKITGFINDKIAEHQLSMRVLKCEPHFNSNKVIVYFSSPGRVDFRELVKDIASGIKARVELKQIGSRDETKILGGIGICGREYCCSSFLREFIPISIRMAKNQNLALNPNKVSGGCGRLLCCLTYENETYSQLKQLLPPKGSSVKILSEGLTGRVLKTDLFNQTVLLELAPGQERLLKVDEVDFAPPPKKKPQPGPQKPRERERNPKPEGIPQE